MTDSRARQVRYVLPNGLAMAGLEWGDPTRPLLLAFHGWLDNAATHSRLAPLLASHYHVVSLDLPGHGLSSHRDAQGDYDILSAVTDVVSLLRHEISGPVFLLGHSLGGIVASLVSVCVPERVQALSMIDSLGPQVAKASDFTRELKRAVARRSEHRSSTVPEYASLEEAIEARCNSTLPLSRSAAEVIVPRNLRRSEKGWSWRTDPRLRYPSLHKLTEDQVSDYLRQIDCPTQVLYAGEGILDKAHSMMAGRYDKISELVVNEVSGGHHCHLDGDIEGMADLILGFFEGRLREQN